MSTEQLLGVAAASRFAGVTRRGILRAIEDGRLYAVQLGGPGSPYVIDRADIEAYAARRRGARK